MAHESIIQKRDSLKINVGSLTVEGVKITDYNVIHSSKEIPSVEDEPTLRDSDYYANATYTLLQSMNFLTFKDRIYPYQISGLLLFIRHSSRLVESICTRKKRLYSTAQIKRTWCNNNRFHMIELLLLPNQKLEGDREIPELLKTMPHIGAVPFFLEEVFHEARKTPQATDTLIS